MKAEPRRLAELIAGLEPCHVAGDLGVAISGIQVDSRQIRPGDLFVAVTGLQQNGHRFISDAVARGASAALVGEPCPGTGLKALVQVEDTRLALARVSAELARHPSLGFSLIGITGTNGKTTLTYLLEQIVLAEGGVPGVIGTINSRFCGKVQDASHTTPEACDLQDLLGRMGAGGVTHVALEVSSHALDLQRVRGSHFRVGVFTNLSRDHLDYHGDLARYAQTKSLLFSRELAESRAADRVAVVNFDDPHKGAMIHGWSGEVLTFGFSDRADVHPVGEALHSLDGFRTRVAFPGGEVDLHSHLIGTHNLANVLTAFSVARAVGLSAAKAAAGIEACRIVPGRLERVNPGERPAVFVDYAHTDDALSNVLSSLRPLMTGRLITVFGCGGDRDRGKRPLMGLQVARGADLAVLTSDNPRTEEPRSILEQVSPGLLQGGFQQVPEAALGVDSRKVYCVVEDRKQAIYRAIRSAREEDVVLIAGKGHETYQIIGTTRIHFDDREEAALSLQRSREEEGP